MHWKQAGSAAIAAAAFFVPWAWPDMPDFLHFVVWPVVAVGIFYAAVGWNRERRKRGLVGLDGPQIIILIGLAIVAFGVGWQIFRVQPSAIPPPARVEPPASNAPAKTSQLLPTITNPVDSTPPRVLSDGRIVIGVTPDYLCALYKNNPVLRAEKITAEYIGKWIEVSGLFDDARPPHSKPRFIPSDPIKSEILVTFAIDADRWPTNSTMMYFDAERWSGYLELLERGQRIHVRGEIEEITSSFLTLRECEILDAVANRSA